MHIYDHFNFEKFLISISTYENNIRSCKKQDKARYLVKTNSWVMTLFFLRVNVFFLFAFKFVGQYYCGLMTINVKIGSILLQMLLNYFIVTLFQLNFVFYALICFYLLWKNAISETSCLICWFLSCSVSKSTFCWLNQRYYLFIQTELKYYLLHRHFILLRIRLCSNNYYRNIFILKDTILSIIRLNWYNILAYIGLDR